jgi:hypothetical protein
MGKAKSAEPDRTEKDSPLIVIWGDYNCIQLRGTRLMNFGKIGCRCSIRKFARDDLHRILYIDIHGKTADLFWTGKNFCGEVGCCHDEAAGAKR